VAGAREALPPGRSPRGGRIAAIASSRRQLLAEGLLVGVAAVWGSTFVLVKDAVALYPTLPFIAVRFALATLVLLPLALVRLRRSALGSRPAQLGSRNYLRAGLDLRSRRVVRGGLVMGLFLGAGYIFQTFGLERTTASNAGFITGLFVVLTPLLQAVLFRVWIGRGALAGVLLAFAGLFLLSGGAAGLQGQGAGHLGGDFLVFLCAVSFAAHILATSRYAADEDPIVLTTIQLAVVGLLAGALTVASWLAGLSELPELPREPRVLVALGVTAIFASALGFFIQTYAQTYSPPTRTAVILTMEPVFAGYFAYLWADERLSAAGWVGAGLILAGMLVTELLPGESRKWVHVEEGTAWVGEEDIRPQRSPGPPRGEP
jgi:drug/metabolite transporter (DMT)-like permease